MSALRTSSLALLGALLSCSLTPLANLGAGHCHAHSECAPLNARMGIAQDALALWQCSNIVPTSSDGVCVFRACRDDDNDQSPDPRCAPAGTGDCDPLNAQRGRGPQDAFKEQTCDGVDNNCDGVVDEGHWLPPPSVLRSGVGTAAELSAALVDGSLTVGLVDGPSVSVVTATSSSARQLRTRGSDTDNFSPAPSDTAGCGGAIDCPLTELNLAPLGSGALLALGRLPRVDVVTTRRLLPFLGTLAGTTLDSFAPMLRTPVRSGIDVPPGAVLGTGSRSMRNPAGASRPALRSLLSPSGAPRALAAWVTGAESEGCLATPRPVDASLLWPERDSVQDMDTVQASNSGLGTTLGTSSSGAAPAIIPLDPQFGFLVLWPGPMAGTVAGALVGPSATGPTVTPAAQLATCLSNPRMLMPAPTIMTCDQEVRATGPLTLRALPALTLGAAPLASVAAAAGPLNGASRTLGLAWTEGCDATNTAARFAVVTLDAAGAQWSAGAAATLASGALTGLQLANLADGAVVETDPQMPLPQEQRGGWAAAWRGTDAQGLPRLQLRRVRRSGEVLDDAVLASAGGPASVVLRASLVESADGSAAALAYLERGGELRSSALRCGGTP